MDFIRCPKKKESIYVCCNESQNVRKFCQYFDDTKIIVQIDYFSVVLSFRKFDFWTRCVKSRKIIRHGSIKHNNLVRVYLQN